MKTRILFCIVVIVALMGHGVAKAQEASADTLMKHIRMLSSSRFEGRMAGTKGYMNAAEYAISVLERYGVQRYDESWMQYLFDVECNQVESATMNTYVNPNDVRKPYVLGKDFACASMTGRGYADAPVVFCGYGIDNAIYDEYARVDAKGKIVMVLTGTPSFLPGSVAQSYETLRDKARVAKAHGALALVAVNMSERCRQTEVQCQMYCGEGPHLLTFPILQFTQWSGRQLLSDERITLDSAIAMIQNTQKPFSFLLDKKFELRVNATYNPNAKTANVVGYKKGKDPRLNRELIVVGASLDHVGMQGHTCLFPGADNNASGVAALLEVARLLNEDDEHQGRSVVFVLFSGGEHRHVGAEYFVRCMRNLEWVDAFLNIGSIGSGDSIVVLGSKRYPIISSIVEANDSLYTQSVKNGIVAAPCEDAAPFDRVGIPSVNIFTSNGRRYDHVPSDFAENINRRLATRATTLLYHTILQLCNGDYQGRSEESRYIRFDHNFEKVNLYLDKGSVDAN